MPLQQSTKPKLFVIGSRDEFTSMGQYMSRIKQLQGEINLTKVIDGKNHFEIEQPTYDEDIATWVHEFISTQITPTNT